ncbi:MAG: CBS domain-containing protein [Alphaproteobacteria bacterium]
MNVRTILSTKGSSVETILPSASITEAAKQLRNRNLGALIVSNTGTTVDGILSERDIIRALAISGAQTLDKRVDDLMTADVHTCTPDDTVADIMVKMTAKRIRHVPVVNDDALCGIISIGDVVKIRLEEVESEAHALRDYISSG